MKFADYGKKFSDLKATNHFHRYLIFSLLGVMAIQTAFLFKKETVVVIEPWTLTADAQLESNHASRNYKEAWALAVAEMLGNITPGNVDFVLERLKPLLAPKIYNNVIRDANEQVVFLKEDRISQTFLPRSVEFEKSTGKVFVKGHAFIQGAGTNTGGGTSDKPIRNEMTFEFRIRINNYLPIFEDIAVYTGQARTTKVLSRMEAAERREKEREAKYRNRIDQQ